jgi:dihydrofolate reductase
VTLSFVFAMGRNREIGLNNQLPWRLPADLKFFKKVTMGHPIIMGRKTYESIGRPLPGRTNVIVTRQQDFQAAGCTVVHSIDEVNQTFANDEVYVIGGTELFKSFLPQADQLIVTYIDADFEADTYFPDIPSNEWILDWSEPGVKDEKNPYDFEFRIYKRAAAPN